MKKAFIAIIASAALAAIPTKVLSDDLPAGASMLPDSPETRMTSYGDVATSAPQEKYQGLPVVRFDIDSQGEKPWSIASNIPAEKGVSKGDLLVMAFFAKSCDSETTETNVRLQKNKDPYTGLVSAAVKVGSEWQLVSACGIMKEDFPAEDIALTIQMGAKKQSLEIAGLTVVNLGKVDEAFLASSRKSGEKEPEKGKQPAKTAVKAATTKASGGKSKTK